MKGYGLWVLLAIFALPLVAGCSSLLAARPDPTKFYVLAPISGGGASLAAHPLAVGIGPVKFPDYLNHSEMVTRVSPNRVDLSSTSRWAEPLDESFRRILALNLATLIGTERVVQYPWDPSVKLDYRIEVTVERFERESPGGTQLIADWWIRGGSGDRPLLVRQSIIGASSAGETTDDAVAALSTDLGDLSKQIADAVIELDSPGHGSTGG